MLQYWKRFSSLGQRFCFPAYNAPTHRSFETALSLLFFLLWPQAHDNKEEMSWSTAAIVWVSINLAFGFSVKKVKVLLELLGSLHRVTYFGNSAHCKKANCSYKPFPIGSTTSHLIAFLVSYTQFDYLFFACFTHIIECTICCPPRSLGGAGVWIVIIAGWTVAGLHG